MNAIPATEPSSIIITLDANKRVHTNFQGTVSLDTALTMMFTGILSMMNSAAQSAIEAAPAPPEGVDPDEVPTRIRGEIYDMVNSAAAGVLDMFMPTPSNPADALTAQAILKAENELLDSLEELDSLDSLDQITVEEVIADTNNVTPFPTSCVEDD